MKLGRVLSLFFFFFVQGPFLILFFFFFHYYYSYYYFDNFCFAIYNKKKDIKKAFKVFLPEPLIQFSLSHETYHTQNINAKQGKQFTSNCTSIILPVHGCEGIPFPHSPGLRSLGIYDLPHDHGSRHAHHKSCHHCCHTVASGYKKIRE